MKNESGSSILQVLMVMALTVMVGSGIAQIISVTAREQTVITDRSRADAFSQFMALTISNNTACNEILKLHNLSAPIIGQAYNLSLNVQNASGELQNIDAGPGKLNHLFGLEVSSLQLRMTESKKGQLTATLKTKHGVSLNRNIGELDIIPGNPAKCAGGAPAAVFNCQQVGGVLQVNEDGVAQCVLLPPDVPPCSAGDGNSFISDINSNGSDCATGKFECPAGKYLVGIRNMKPYCLSIAGLVVSGPTAAPTPAPTAGATPAPTPTGACLAANTVINQRVAVCMNENGPLCNLNAAAFDPIEVFHSPTDCCTGLTNTIDEDDCTDIAFNGGAKVGGMCWRIRKVVCQ